MSEDKIRSEIKRLRSLLAESKGRRAKQPRTTAVRITHDGSVEKVSTQQARKMMEARGSGRKVTIIVNRSRAVN